MPIKRCCLACGRFAEVTANKWCRPPEPDFEGHLTAMSEEEIERALSDRDPYFCEQLDRLICRMMRETRLTEGKAAMNDPLSPSYVMPQPKQPSTDVERYGSQIEVETPEGTEEVDLEAATEDDSKLDTDKPDSEEKPESKDEKDSEDDIFAEPVESDLEKIAEVQQAEAADEEAEPNKARVDASVATTTRISERLNVFGTKSQSFPLVEITRPDGSKAVVDPLAPYIDNEQHHGPFSGGVVPVPIVPREMCQHKNNPKTCWLCVAEETSKAKAEALSPEERAARQTKFEEEQAARKQQVAVENAKKILGVGEQRVSEPHLSLPVEPKQPFPEPGESIRAFLHSSRLKEYQKQVLCLGRTGSAVRTSFGSTESSQEP